MTIHDRINWRAIIERHEQLDKQIQRGYILSILSGLVAVFIGAQVWRGKWAGGSLLVEIALLLAVAGLFIGAMLIVFGGYQVSNLPYPDDDEDENDSGVRIEADHNPSPPLITPKSRNHFIRINDGLSQRERWLMCTAVQKNNWRFSRAILDQAGIPDLTSYVDDGRTRYGVVRDELIRAGYVIDNHIPYDKQDEFVTLPQRANSVVTSGLPLTTTGGGGERYA